MDALNDVISSEDLKKFEGRYNDQVKTNSVTRETKFEYAWGLVRSKYPADIKKGILILEELCKENSSEIRDYWIKDYWYYLAIGNARLKEYSQALRYCRRFLEIEPLNQQVQELESIIKSKMDKEGAIGIAITAGFAMIAATAVFAGVAISKRKF